MSGIRVIISGGGTGGHIYPAIAIADAVKSFDSEADILFVGAKGRMEMEKVPAAGYPIEGLTISGIQRKFTAKNLSVPFKVIGALWRSGSIIEKFKPDVAVGVGGYASWALVQTATWKNVPALLQEQNSYAGLTNKLLAPKAQKICVAYPGMEKHFPADRLFVTGNPVRQDIVDLARYRAEAFAHYRFDSSKKTVLVIGGSLGARTLNEAMAKGVRNFLENDVQVIWQTGKHYYEDMEKLAIQIDDERLRVLPFIAEMHYAYAVADAVVSRAGALSVSELCLAGKPTVFVPSPNVTEDHQTKNALALVNDKAAVMVKDAEAEHTLIAEAVALLKDERKQTELKSNLTKWAKPDAAKEIAQHVISLRGTIVKRR